MQSKKIGLYLLLFFFLNWFISSNTPCFAWGPIGHRMIAETAALLAARNLPTTWGPFLARHRFELGVYSILPDAVFRHGDGKSGTLEGKTHYFDLDIAIGLKPGQPDFEKETLKIPFDYKEAQKYLEKKINNNEKFKTVGNAPWRVEQLQDLAWNSLKSVKKIKGAYERGKTSSGEIKNIYDGIFYLGILSHYTGDSSMPYHALSDWNGYSIGQGGIHFYFESDCVNYLEPGLSQSVLEEALMHQKEWKEKWNQTYQSPASVMLRMFLDSALAVEAITKIDSEKAITKYSKPGTETDAIRKSPEEICPIFKSILVGRLAKGAVLTDYFWEMVLPKSIDFSESSKFQFSDFETNPDYIVPKFDPSLFLAPLQRPDKKD